MKKPRKDKKKPRKLICLNCNNEFIKNISDNKFKNGDVQKFCKQKCAAQHQGGKNKGEKNGMFGKKSWCNGLTKDTDNRIKNIALGKTGDKHHFYNKKLTDDHKIKIKKSLKNSEKFQTYIKLSLKERFKLKYGDSWEIKYSERLNRYKGMFNLEWFVGKHGEHKGTILYNERCNLISEKSHYKIYNKTNKNNYSKKSQNLFWDIYDNINENYDYIYFAELNNEYSCSTGKYNYDFVIKDIKTIIEFNGNKFHPRENDSEWTSAYGITYEEAFNSDKLKRIAAEKNGYKIIYIWEDEYEENYEKVKKDIYSFIKLYEHEKS